MIATKQKEVIDPRGQRKNNIIKDGSNYRMFGDVGLIDQLPNIDLEVKSSMFGLYLAEAAPTMLPDKIYSNDKTFIEHVVKTYEQSEGSLGILLSGKKGLGKSFTANVIAKYFAQPIIRITDKFEHGSDLFSFLNKIEQPHTVFIDEFEKTFVGDYTNDNKYMKQTDFLSYLDNGSIGTKRLFIITANSSVSEYLMNRPSRLRYHRQYEKLDISVIREIVDDLLVNKDFQQDLIDNVPQRNVNIDVLIKIIQEVNLHEKPYSTFKSFFNFQADKIEEVNVVRDNGQVLMEDVSITLPLKKGTYLYEDTNDNDVCVDEILSETPMSITVKTRVYNDRYTDDQTLQEYIYEVVNLKRKSHLLF